MPMLYLDIDHGSPAPYAGAFLAACQHVTFCSHSIMSDKYCCCCVLAAGVAVRPRRSDVQIPGPGACWFMRANGGVSCVTMV